MVPVEVVPFESGATLAAIEALPSVAAAQGKARLRVGSSANNKVDGDGATLAATDNGNHVVDIAFGAPLADPAACAAELKATVGVVEHGLFVGMANHILVARSDGSVAAL